MAAIKTFKIFISHGFKANEDYDRLVETLDTYFTYGHSVISTPADARHRKLSKSGLESELRTQIRNANIFIALDGLYRQEDPWARYELEYAVSLGKPILALRMRNVKDLSKILENVATLPLGWNPDVLAGSIVKYAVPVQINLK